MLLSPRHSLVSIVGVLALWGALPIDGVTAQGPVKVGIESDDLILSVNEEHGMPLTQFVKLAQEMTRKTFTYSEKDFADLDDPNLRFTGKKRMKKGDFYEFFEQIMRSKGLGLVERGQGATEVIEIVPLERLEVSADTKLLRTCLAKMRGIPVAFSMKQESDSPMLRQFRGRGRGNPFGGSAADGARGVAVDKALQIRMGDEEVIFAGRRMVARQKDGAWKLRQHRLADGAALPSIPQTDILLDLLAGQYLVVTHSEVGTLDGRPIQILSATLTPDQAVEMAWDGQLPEASPLTATVLRGFGRRVVPPRPDLTVDMAFLVDPSTKLLHELRVRVAEPEQGRGGVRIGGGRGGAGAAVQIVQVGVGGAEVEEEEEEEEDGPPADPNVFTNGFPGRDLDDKSVVELTIRFTEHGAAKLELDPSAALLLNVR